MEMSGQLHAPGRKRVRRIKVGKEEDDNNKNGEVGEQQGEE
jgi:hypothetical protein